MRLALLIILSVSFVTNLNAQATVSTDGGMVLLVNLDDGDSSSKFERGKYNGEHVLGDTITSLLNKFEASYVYYVELEGAYSTKEKKIEKSDIYFSTNKLLKDYKKSLKKDRISEDKAREELIIIMNNVIKLKKYHTENLELLLSENNNVDYIKDTFMNLRFVN